MATFFIATSYSDASIPNYYRKIGASLAKRGHKVVMLYDGNAIIETKNPLVEEHVWPSRRPTKLKDMLFLIRLILIYKPDYMLLNFGSVNISTIAGFIFGVKRRVAWYHTTIEQQKIDHPPKYFKILRKRLIYKLNTHIIAVSNYAKNDLIKHFKVNPDKCYVKYNLINSLNTSHDHKKEKFSIVCAGRLDRSKGQDVLIKSLIYLKDKYPHLKIYIIGDGKLKNEYISLAKKLNVFHLIEFTGSLPNKDVIEKFSQATLCVVPSLVDNLPTVSLEAQSVGTPVIISESGGMPETIINEVSGLLFEPGNEKDLAQKIDYLMANNDVLEEMSLGAKRVFEKKFSFKNLDTYCNDFEKIIADNQ